MKIYSFIQLLTLATLSVPFTGYALPMEPPIPNGPLVHDTLPGSNPLISRSALIPRKVDVRDIDGVTIMSFNVPATYVAEITHQRQVVSDAHSDKDGHAARLSRVRAAANKRFAEEQYRLLGEERELADMDPEFIPQFQADYEKGSKDMEGVVAYVDSQQGHHGSYRDIDAEVHDLADGIKSLNAPF